MLACAFCGERRQIAVHAAIPEAPAETIPDALAVRETALREARCANCGGSTEVASVTAATRCAFCTHPLTVDPNTPARLPAHNIVPFVVDKTQAAEAFQRWLSGLWFRPNDLARAAKLESMRGVYIPAWIFSAYAQSSWTAEAGYHYYVDEWVEVNGQKQQRRVQHTRWQPASGHHQHHYRSLFVSASRGLTESEIVELEPFDLASSMVSFEDDFLAGFEAESLAVTARSAWVPAHQRVERMEHSACDQQVPGDTHRSLNVHTQVGHVQATSALVPIYVAAYVYAGTVYRLLVNGQSQKVIGKAPYSAYKIAAAILAALILIGVVVALSN